MFREHTKTVTIGNKKIGGGNPVLIPVYDQYPYGRCRSNGQTDTGTGGGGL